MEAHPRLQVGHRVSVHTSRSEGEEDVRVRAECDEEAGAPGAVAEGVAHGGIPAEGAEAGVKQAAATALRSHRTLECRTAQQHARSTRSHSTSWLYALAVGAESVAAAIAIAVVAAEAPVAVAAVAGLAPDSDPFPTRLHSGVGVARTSNSVLEGVTIQSKGEEGCSAQATSYCCLPSSASSPRAH